MATVAWVFSLEGCADLRNFQRCRGRGWPNEVIQRVHRPKWFKVFSRVFPGMEISCHLGKHLLYYVASGCVSTMSEPNVCLSRRGCGDEARLAKTGRGLLWPGPLWSTHPVVAPK